MARELSVVPLKCTGCGAGLGISADMTRFACGYCGTEQIVERRGGTVALKPITDAIAKVQVGTDKTAAELALNRLPHELNYLISKRRGREFYWLQKIDGRKGSVLNRALLVLFASWVILIPTVGIAVFLAEGPAWLLAIGEVLVIPGGGAVAFLTYLRALSSRDADIQQLTVESNRELTDLDSQIKALSEKIEENRRIANS